MNDFVTAVAKEIESCAELLKIFQQERRLYCENTQIGIAEVTGILGRKKQLVEIFDRQHLLMKTLREQSPELPAAIQSEQKEQMRRLGSILEQLLVIDHENEKLLRENISCRRLGNDALQPSAAMEPAVRPRPALQRQLPFVPGLRPAAPYARPDAPVKTPISAPADNAAGAEETERERVAGRHLLRKYIQNNSGLTSKYA